MLVYFFLLSSVSFLILSSFLFSFFFFLILLLILFPSVACFCLKERLSNYVQTIIWDICRQDRCPIWYLERNQASPGTRTVAGVGRMGLLGLVPHIDWLGMCLRLCRLIKEEQNILIKIPIYDIYYLVQVQYKYERSRVMILQYIGCVFGFLLRESKRNTGPNL